MPIEDPPDGEVPCPARTPAETLETLHQDDAMRTLLLTYFEGDDELQTLAEGLFEGWPKDDLLALFDNDERRYATIRKRYRRKTEKLRGALPQPGGPHDQDHAQEADDR